MTTHAQSQMTPFVTLLTDVAAMGFFVLIVWGVWAFWGMVAHGLGLTRLQLLGLGWLTGFFR